MDIVVGSGHPRAFTTKDAARLPASKSFKPVIAVQLTSADAAGRAARLGTMIDWSLGVLAAALCLGGCVYWAVAEDNFERSELLPFPFVAGAAALFALWFFRRRRKVWPARLAERARDCPPPGSIAVSEAGLSLGDQTHAWANLTLRQLTVLSRSDEGSLTYLINRLLLVGPDGPFSLDVYLMRGGQPIVDAVYVRLKPSPESLPA